MSGQQEMPVALIVGAGDYLGAEIYWQLHCQPWSAWSFEADVRTYVEPW